MKPTVDYSLYLVTDNTPAILGPRLLPPIVRSAILSGVTLVQYRAKNTPTSTMIHEARALLTECHATSTPLLINDRLDVALAIAADGVHIGQDDMSASDARALLGPDKIIGVTVNDVETALKACRDGADYVGIGTVFATSTKTDTKEIIGTAGVREILAAMAAAGFGHVKTVCIGGLNASNIPRVLYQSATLKKSLDGIAIVSAIIGAQDPAAATSSLLSLIKSPPPFAAVPTGDSPLLETPEEILAAVPAVIKAIDAKKPLSHNMTNLVVQNFAANVALAVGASPIMSNNGDEAGDLANLGGALVINMGTATPEGLENYKKAIKSYNVVGRPVVFDPVGAGATSVRRNAVSSLLATGYFDVIKGNEGEISTVYSSHTTPQQSGVDSHSSLSLPQKVILASSLATRERNIVILTGVTDVISDGRRTYAIRNGHELLSHVTGTGCILGTVVSAALAIAGQVAGGDKLVAVLAAMLLYEVAAEMAAERQNVQGPGTFAVAFVDEIWKLRGATVAGDLRWLTMAKLEKLEVPESSGLETKS